MVTPAYGDTIQTGEAYLIPYFLAVFAFAVPLMVLELAVGRHLRGDGPWG